MTSTMKPLIQFLDDWTSSTTYQENRNELTDLSRRINQIGDLAGILFGEVDFARQTVSQSQLSTMTGVTSTSTLPGNAITLQAKPKKKISVTSVGSDAIPVQTVATSNAQTTFNSNVTNMDSSIDPRMELLRSRSIGKRQGSSSSINPSSTVSQVSGTSPVKAQEIPGSPRASISQIIPQYSIPSHIVRRHLVLAKILRIQIQQQQFAIEKVMLLLLQIVNLVGESQQSVFSMGMIEDNQLLSHPSTAIHFLAVFIYEAPQIIGSLGKYYLRKLHECKLLAVLYPNTAQLLQEICHHVDRYHPNNFDAPNFGAETWTMNSFLSSDHSSREGDETRKDLKTKEAKAIFTERENCFDAFKSLLHRCEGHINKAGASLLAAGSSSTNSNFAQGTFSAVYENIALDIRKCCSMPMSKTGSSQFSSNLRIIPQYRENWQWFANMFVDKLLACIIDTTERHLPSPHVGAHRPQSSSSHLQPQLLQELLQNATDTWLSSFVHIVSQSAQTALVHTILDSSLRKVHMLWSDSSTATTNTASIASSSTDRNSTLWHLRYIHASSESYSGRMFCLRILGKWMHRVQHVVLPELFGYSLLSASPLPMMMGCYLPWEEWCQMALQQGTMSMFVTFLVEVFRPPPASSQNTPSVMLVQTEQTRRLYSILRSFVEQHVLAPLATSSLVRSRGNSLSQFPVPVQERSAVSPLPLNRPSNDLVVDNSGGAPPQFGIPSNRMWVWLQLQELFAFPSFALLVSPTTNNTTINTISNNTNNNNNNNTTNNNNNINNNNNNNNATNNNTNTYNITINSNSSNSNNSMVVQYNYSEQSIDAQSWALSSEHFVQLHAPQFLISTPLPTVAVVSSSQQKRPPLSSSTAIPKTGAAATFQTLSSKSQSMSHVGVHPSTKRPTASSSIVRNLFPAQSSSTADSNDALADQSDVDSQNLTCEAHTFGDHHIETDGTSDNVMAMLLATCLAETQSVASAKSQSSPNRVKKSSATDTSQVPRSSSTRDKTQQLQSKSPIKSIQSPRHRARSQDSLGEVMTLPSSTTTTATRQHSQTLSVHQPHHLGMSTAANSSLNGMQARTMWAPSPTNFRLTKSPHLHVNSLTGTLPPAPMSVSRQISTASYTTSISNQSHTVPAPLSSTAYPQSLFSHSNYVIPLSVGVGSPSFGPMAASGPSPAVYSQTLQAIRVAFWERQKTLHAVQIFIVQNYCDAVMLHVRRLLEEHLPTFSDQCDTLLSQPPPNPSDSTTSTTSSDATQLSTDANKVTGSNQTVSPVPKLRDEDLYLHFSQVLHNHADPYARKVCTQGGEAFNHLGLQALQQVTSIFRWHHVPTRVLHIAIFLTAQTLNYWQQRFMNYLQEYCQRKLDETIAFKISKYLEQQRELRTKNYLAAAKVNGSNAQNKYSNPILGSDTVTSNTAKPSTVKVSYLSAMHSKPSPTLTGSIASTPVAIVTTVGVPVDSWDNLQTSIQLSVERLKSFEIVLVRPTSDNVSLKESYSCCSSFSFTSNAIGVCVLGQSRAYVSYAQLPAVKASSSSKPLTSKNAPNNFDGRRILSYKAHETHVLQTTSSSTSASTTVTTPTTERFSSSAGGAFLPASSPHAGSVSAKQTAAAFANIPDKQTTHRSHLFSDIPRIPPAPGLSQIHAESEPSEKEMNESGTQDAVCMPMVTAIDAVKVVNLVSLGLDTWVKLLLSLAQGLSQYPAQITSMAPYALEKIWQLFAGYCRSLASHLAAMSASGTASGVSAVSVKLRGAVGMSLVQILPLTLLVDYHYHHHIVGDKKPTKQEHTATTLFDFSFTAIFIHSVMQPGGLTSAAQVHRTLAAIARDKIAAYYEHCRGIAQSQRVLRPLSMRVLDYMKTLSDAELRDIVYDQWHDSLRVILLSISSTAI